MNETTRESEANRAKLARMEAALTDLLEAALRQGMYGTVAIELAIQDGTIQHVRQRIDRVER